MPQTGETARTLLHLALSARRSRLSNHPRFPAAVLLRSAIQKRDTAKPVSWVSLEPTIPASDLFLAIQGAPGTGGCILGNVREYKTILLGGGMVAGYAVKQLVENGLTAGELGIVSADNALPYERPPLSKSFLAGRDDEQSVLINSENFYREHGIGIHLSTRVERIDLAGKRLMLGSGEDFHFSRLILATGARVRTLDVPGADREDVLYLRSLSDSARLRDRLRTAKKVAVIGSGFIGMEVASQSAQLGRDTTMIFPQDRVWKNFFTPQMSHFFEKYYRDRDVQFAAGASVEAIGANSVSLSTGARLEADLVVAGIGVTPVTEIAAEAGLKVDNGIVVNEFLETGAAGVYAAGDVANYHDILFGKRRRIEHWDNAVKQGQYVARRLGGEAKPFENIPYFFSDIFDLSYEFWGDTAGAERTEYRGDMNSASFSAWWLKGDQVLAAFVMNRPDAEREAASQLRPVT